jgi:hypothetical protein
LSTYVSGVALENVLQPTDVVAVWMRGDYKRDDLVVVALHEASKVLLEVSRVGHGVVSALGAVDNHPNLVVRALDDDAVALADVDHVNLEVPLRTRRRGG